MFCTGTLGELVPVIKVDGRTIGRGARGPVTERLTQLFVELTARVGTVVCG
jgi:branched-chain amino acid aminotransferase